MEKLGKRLFFLAFFFFQVLSFAAEVNVSSKLQPNPAEVGDRITLRIEIKSQEALPEVGSLFNPISVEGLDYIGLSSGASQSFSSFNGKNSVSYTKKLDLSYAATKEGDFTLPALKVSGKNVGPFTIKVFKKLPNRFSRQRQRQKQSRSRGRSLFDQLDQAFGGGFSGTFGQASRAEDPEFFTKVEVDKTQIYKGEQIFARWHIYTNGALNSFDTLKFPTLRGFWKEDVDFATRFAWEPVLVNGKKYRRALLSSYALLPYKEGDYELDPYELRAGVRTGGLFSSSKAKVFKVQSEPVSIKVLPLPAPLPLTYYGGVGNFKIEQLHSEKKKEVFLGETFAFKLRIVGEGSSAKFIKPPKLDLGDEFEIYDQKDEYKFFPKNLSSIKTFVYTLVPKKEGLFRTPDVEVHFFDPEEQVYYKDYLQMPAFLVEKNKNTTGVADEIYKEEDSDVDKKEVFTKFEGGALDAVLSLSLRPALIYSLMFVSFFISVLLVFFILKKKEKEENLQMQLRTKFKDSQTLLEQGNYKLGLNELINVLYLLVGGLSGNRFGTEAEFLIEIEGLPASLKSEKDMFVDLNAKLQELRFGVDLSLSENKVKLKECLASYQALYSKAESFLPQ